MRRGLVLGKFAPFHRGHSHLISTAASGVDDLVVVVYETLWYEIPVATRVRWIRNLHPDVAVVTLPDLDRSTYDDSTVTAAHARQIANAFGSFTDVFTSERYGEELACHLGATHTAVDPGRETVPISATALRQNAYAHREMLDPRVYSSLIRRVVFLGAESTGKTTLARSLAMRHMTAWVPEYGRERWEERGGDLTTDDLEHIARVQLAREEAATLDANRVLFCDTNAVTTAQWCKRLFGSVPRELSRLADDTGNDYVTFLCEPDFAWVQDGTRETPADQLAFQRAIEVDLTERRIAAIRLTGGVEHRIITVEATLGLQSR